MNMEEFKNIPFNHCTHYLVNKDGIVINSKTGRKMKPYKEKGIYERIGLFGDDKKLYKPYVTDILWFTFDIETLENYIKKTNKQKELIELEQLENEFNNII